MNLDIVVDDILNEVKEAQDRNYSEFLLRSDLKKILSNLLGKQKDSIRADLYMLQKEIVYKPDYTSGVDALDQAIDRV